MATESFTGAFLGCALNISEDRKRLDLHFSVNDGNFCIDTQAMSFHLKVSKGKSKIRHALLIKDRETVDDTARWSLNLVGEIILPESLICAHIYEKFVEEEEINKFLKESVDTSTIYTDDIKDLIEKNNTLLKKDADNSIINVYKTLIDHLHRTMNLSRQRHDDWRICRKCDRVTYAKDSLSLGSTRTTSNSMSEYLLEYEIEHYEDTSYRMLSLALSHVFEAFIAFMDIYTKKNKLKVIAIGFPVAALKYQLMNKLLFFTWNHLDAFPCFFETTRDEIESASDSLSRRATRLIGYNNLVRLSIGKNNCVGVDSDCISLFGLNGYRVALLEHGEKSKTQKYNFDSDKSNGSEEKSVKNKDKKSLKCDQSEALCEQGYTNCIQINDHKKVCFKSINPFAFEKVKYTNKCGNIINDLILLSKSFKNTRISFISSTPQGGGVALMRHAHIRMYRMLGMRVNWYVTIPVNKIYEITKKKFHNILQGVFLQECNFQTEFKNESENITEKIEPDLSLETLTDDDKASYEKWIKQNSDRMWSNTVFKNSDIIVLDDHQTSGFAPRIRAINKKVKIIYRSHIQIRGEHYSTESRIKTTWDYISKNFFDQTKTKPEDHPIIDLFLAHPIETFVPSNIPKKLITYLPPSTDLLDGLNKKMSARICRYYQEIFRKACFNSGCPPIDLDETDYILQISRFDPSKGLIDCIEVFASVCDHLESRQKNNQKPLYLILAGHGSVDDPEGTTVFNYMVDFLQQERLSKIRDRVKLVKVPPLDQVLNLLMTKAKIVLQLSKNEGFEIKVTEALLHQKPIIVSDRGGIPLQVFDGMSGFICKNQEQIIEKLLFIIDNYEMMLENVRNVKELGLIHTTPFNIMAWLRTFDKVLKNEPGNQEVAYENLIKKYFKGKKQDMLLEKAFRPASDSEHTE
ncbi:Glycosyltransferase [Pseudoloma neurophilia]|uniref:Glycosyltransferase n=1 Tax=Pseudoloma neurophilia TaxID=146866 RepID=A0A0R0M572_9MICR|nr:Glycosyltransferase [Pseudoloma neurophilia]